MRPFQPKPLPGAPPYVIAHRGISAKAPENTLASFEQAAGVPGIDMIELDVRLTKEEEVIVLHDRTLQRTSTGNGPVRNYSLEEIRKLDAGSWFHPMFAEQRIPTLAEVFQHVGSRLWVDVEIKSDLLYREPSGLLEKKVLDVVHQCGMDDRVMFSSFNHQLLSNIKRMKSSAVTGVLFDFLHDFGRSPSKLAERVGAKVFKCATRELNRHMLNDAHTHGIAVYVYTLNSVQGAQRMLTCRVDGILSNNADDIVSVVKNDNGKR
ncbi:MAG: glycerophosphodiester phosphodiesterase family protein [Ignavibacteriales bacterium]|nr:glycerophosphodiester phosphodiesterase family protein [Ignavibacteriales bacterium]